MSKGLLQSLRLVPFGGARRLGGTVLTQLWKEVADSGHTAIYLRQLLRGNRVEPRAPIRCQGERRPPVLLIHGYLATRGSLHLLERRLCERGYTVMTFRLGPVNLGNIRDSAGLIARKIESLANQTGVEKVDVVGHSMGGLVGLYYLKRLGGRHRVRRMVLLGTPARGTWSALLGIVTLPFGRASLQLLPFSPFLKELAAMPLPPGCAVTAIAGERDWLAPIRSTVLQGCEQVYLPTCHSGLLVDEAVVDTIDRVLGPFPPNALTDMGKSF